MSRVVGFRWALVSIIAIVLMATPVRAFSQAIYSLGIEPVTPTTLFAGGSSGTLKSRDAGATWSATGVTVLTWSLALDPVTSGTIYAATYAGMLKSTDGGASWSAVGPTNLWINSVTIDPVTRTTVYAATGSGVFKSLDGGASWSNAGLSNLPIYSVAVDPVTPTTLYAGAGSGGGWADGVRVFKSTDGGATWTLTGLTGPAWEIYSLALAIDPVMPATVYATYSGWGCDLDGCFTLGVISRSNDGAASWSTIDSVVYGGSWVSPQVWPSAVAIDPVTPTTLYAAWSVSCDQFDPYCQPANWMAKSTDGGETWSRINDLVAYTFAIDPRTSTTLYAGNDSGVLKSTDGGSSWSATGAASPPPPPPSVPDTTAPETSITSATDGTGMALANEAATLAKSVSLSFTGSDNVGVARFECRLDGADFSMCTSPVTYSVLPVGRHTFEVRAVDAAGNADVTAAPFVWNIDVPPDTQIAGAIDGRGKALPNGGATSSNDLTLWFTGTDNMTVARFECQLDTAVFSACTSPVTYTGLGRGTHTFRVRAVDNNGFRDGTPATFTWRRQ